MSDSIANFPGFDPVERDLLALEISTRESVLKVREVRSRVGAVFGFQYVIALLDRLSSGHSVLPKEYDPVTAKLPYPYACQFEKLDVRELELVRRWINAILMKENVRSPRIRKELFYLRSEAIGRMETAGEFSLDD